MLSYSRSLGSFQFELSIYFQPQVEKASIDLKATYVSLFLPYFLGRLIPYWANDVYRFVLLNSFESTSAEKFFIAGPCSIEIFDIRLIKER